MKRSADIFLRLNKWQQRNPRKVAAFFCGTALFWGLLRALNRAIFISPSIELFLRYGIYVFFVTILLGLVFWVNPLLAEYVRRRREGQSAEEAMLFETKRPFTGSVWADAAVFLLIVMVGAGAIFYFVYHAVG